jgi:S1/P1 Nuclease
MRSLLLALITLATTGGNALAWGDTGHRAVCELALRLSTPETRAEIRRLIQTDSEFDSFRDSCIWPDHPRKRASEHFINLARTSEGIEPSGQCPTASTCTLTAIEQDVAVLSSGSANDADKLKSLKFLGHWVGDIHQPLHVSFEDDRGGNNIPVRGHCSTNLHSTWDTCLLQIAIGANVLAAARDLLNSITPAEKEEWSRTNPRDWANESFAITEAVATKYCVQHGSSCDAASGTVVIDDSYVQANAKVLREQLQKAGVRLAHLLESALSR